MQTRRNHRRRCPQGMIKRRGYTRRNGVHVRSVCIRSTSGHRNTFKKNMAKKAATMKKRLAAVLGSKKRCPPGTISRAAYVRRISSRVAREGFNKTTRSGKVVHVYPKQKSMYVKASCVPDLGKAGKLEEGAPRIGPLRKGELRKHGYSYKLPESVRRDALQRAVREFGPLSTYRKLNAVAKLTTLSQPAAASVFAADRNWIRSTYSENGELKAF